MRFLGNIIWLLFGGFSIALEYFAAALIMFVTIIGIPFGVQALKLGVLALWPFGRTVVSKPSAYGCLYVILNIIWLLVAGVWIALSHLFWGVVLCLTVIGIPFGLQHFKMVRMALSPFGQHSF